MKEHIIDVSDGTLYAVESGSGTPLVMVHGWPLDHRMFGHQFDALATDFRCIAIDRRGFGRSTAPPDMRRELDDLDRVIDTLGLGTVHLLGVSQGGRIALRYAATRPDQLRSLLLQGAVVDGFDIEEAETERVPVAHYAALAASGRLDEAMSEWLAHPMMTLPPGHSSEETLLKNIVSDYNGADLIRFEPSHYEFDIDVLATLAACAVPALILTGAGETAARKRHAHEICSTIPNCCEVILAESGHLSNLTEPGAFNRAVREFLEAIDSQAA